MTRYWPNLFSLQDKMCVVTGGAGLLGSHLVEGFAQAGSTVFIAEFDQAAGQRLARELASEQVPPKWVALDITDPRSIAQCIDDVVALSGHLDVWVNCAYPRTKDWAVKFEDIPFDSWQRNVDMHLNGYFACCQQAARVMQDQRAGCIINISSIYGVVGPDFSIYEGTDMTMPAAYSAIKGGINTFTKYLATYFAKDGIRANVVCPGGIFNDQPPSFVERYNQKVPLGRMGRPEEIVGPVLFLASDAASYITGQVIMVDGGYSTY